MPFAKDIEGTLLCLKIGDTGVGSVITVDPSDDTVSENLNQTFGEYIEQISQKLLTRKLVYEEGLGFVSVA